LSELSKLSKPFSAPPACLQDHEDITLMGGLEQTAFESRACTIAGRCAIERASND
jgi:hypothetical protein